MELIELKINTREIKGGTKKIKSTRAIKLKN